VLAYVSRIQSGEIFPKSKQLRLLRYTSGWNDCGSIGWKVGSAHRIPVVSGRMARDFVGSPFLQVPTLGGPAFGSPSLPSRLKRVESDRRGKARLPKSHFSPTTLKDEKLGFLALESSEVPVQRDGPELSGYSTRRRLFYLHGKVHPS
jgi:hypothetical protein